jgi:iron(III) transport system permease protein
MANAQRIRWTYHGLALLLLGLVGVLVVWPLAQLFGPALAVDGTPGGGLAGMLVDPGLQESLLRTLAVALLACGLASLLALPAAFAAVRGPAALRRPLQLLGILPLLLPPFVSAGLLPGVMTSDPMLTATWEIVGIQLDAPTLILASIYALHYLPLMFLCMVGGLARLDRAYAETARNLGAGRLYTWRRITLPLATPPFALGAALMTLKVVEDVGTPLLLGIDQMLAPQLLLRLGAGSGHAEVASAALPLLLSTGLIVALAWSALAPRTGESGRQSWPRPQRWRSGAATWIAALGFLVGLAVTVALPWTLVWPLVAPLDPELPSAAIIGGKGLQQMLLAAGAGVILMLLGTLSMALMRSRGLPAALTRATLGSLFAVPGALLAAAFVVSLGGTTAPMAPDLMTLSLILLVALKTLPYLPHLLTRWRESYNSAQLELARSLGTARAHTLLRTLLPLPITLLLALLFLGAAAALNEWSAALVLLQHGDLTLAAEVFNGLMDAQGDAVTMASVVLLAGLNALLLLPALALFGLAGRRGITSTDKTPCDPRETP